jgi:hypothetical protein
MNWELVSDFEGPYIEWIDDTNFYNDITWWLEDQLFVINQRFAWSADGDTAGRRIDGPKNWIAA